MTRPFTPPDLGEMNLWYAARGLPEVPAAALPKTGRIEPGIACGFLYRTDSSIVLLDGYIANPAVSLRKRRLALEDITVSLLKTAWEDGALRVLALSKSRGIARMAGRFGFVGGGLSNVMARDF